jgi:pimeloyl-ACP methyl ester carboxylesterase
MLSPDASRTTFVRTARTVIDMRGQAISPGEQISSLSERELMLIWGADDRTIPPRHHRELAARFPRARQLEIPAAGHFPQETAPHIVGPAIEEFLAHPS